MKAEGFRRENPFICGNMTGTTVILIEPGSLRLLSDEELAVNGTRMVNLMRVNDRGSVATSEHCLGLFSSGITS